MRPTIANPSGGKVLATIKAPASVTLPTSALKCSWQIYTVRISITVVEIQGAFIQICEHKADAIKYLQRSNINRNYTRQFHHDIRGIGKS